MKTKKQQKARNHLKPLCKLFYRLTLDGRVGCLRTPEIEVPYGMSYQELALMLGVRLEEMNLQHFKTTTSFTGTEKAREAIESGTLIDITNRINAELSTIESYLRKTSNTYSTRENAEHCRTGEVLNSELHGYASDPSRNGLVFRLGTLTSLGPYFLRGYQGRIDVGEKLIVYSISGFEKEARNWKTPKNPDAVSILDNKGEPKLDIILNSDIIISDSPFKREDLFIASVKR